MRRSGSLISDEALAVPARTTLLPSLGRATSRSAWHTFLYAILIGWVAALVLAESTGRLGLGRALFLVALPIVAVGVAIRPAWVVLLVAAIPLLQPPTIPMRALALLMLVTLVGQLVMRGSLSVGLRSGFLALVVLVTIAFFFQDDLTGDTALFASGVLSSLAFLVLLGLVSYNATRTRDLQGKHVVNAILFGLALSVVLEHTILSSGATFLGLTSAPVGRPTAYLAAMGFALCFARLLIPTEGEGYYHRGVHLVLAIAFAVGMISGLVRGAWLSALVAILFVSVWARKSRYLLLAILALIVMLAVPVARDRVVPNEEQAAGGGFTTGRLDLWTHLWNNEIEPTLPWGNGFGHTFTVSSEDAFGEGSTSFATSEGSTFVYPHNDFIFLMVELGLVGLVLVVLFWSQLLIAFRSVSRTASENKPHVQILGGVLITAFVVQFVGSLLLFTLLATPFFVAAGFVFGTRESRGSERIQTSSAHHGLTG
jgi:O-antigen ligase